MKRILLLCSLLLAISCAYAQTGKPVPVVKSDFMSKANEIDNYISVGNLTKAKTSFDDLNVMIGTNLHVDKYDAKDAVDAKDNTKLNTVQQRIRDQWQIFSDLSELATDMKTNRSKIYAKIMDYTKTL
jgi:hypothetical protein